jgi:very-short-patch-repair endonuclease
MWDEYKLAVEIDGAQHAEDPLQHWDDIAREILKALRAAGALAGDR